MDRDSLPPGYLEAGEEYLSALRKLGLDPDGLFWARDATMGEFVLVLITSQVDFVGPMEVYRLLTHAYNLAATPAAISPFIVRIHSPAQHIVERISNVWRARLKFHGSKGWREAERSLVHVGIEDLQFHFAWVYAFNPKKLKAADRVRKWARFKRNVEALAA